MAYADLISPARLRRFLQRQGLWTRRRLGQHFLVDRNVVCRILEVSGVGAHDRVLEIGPGLGVVTRPLAERAAQVVALELDERLFPALRENLAGLNNVRLVQGDILRVDLPELLGGDGWQVVANLPYYLTTPAITRLLAQGELFGRITLMVQRELADRLVAPPGSKSYGSLSVFAQSRREVTRELVVSASCFYPPPRVESAVVVLSPGPALVPPELEGDFERAVRAAFGQRRKRLGNALAHALGLPAATVDAALGGEGVDPGARAESLSVTQYLSVARAVRRLREEGAA